jgi:hypothetical protein
MLQAFVLTLALAGGAGVDAQPDALRPDALPNGFLPNGGQWPKAVRFRSMGGGASCWFVDNGWWLSLREGERRVALRMSFEGAHPARAKGEALLPGSTNVFIGDDPAGWARNLRASASVRWPSSWDGVDLLVRAPREGAGLFEYDLELAPGAELADVVLRCAGHESLAVDADGSLVIETAVGALVQPPPTAWQLRGAVPEAFACRFRVLDSERFGFEATGRDPQLAAVVDPALLFSTYLSGQAEQTVEEVEPGLGGTVIVAGTTISDDFPTTPGAFEEFFLGDEDLFVSCLSADGTQLVWSTYLGGFDPDFLRGMSVDAAGRVTVCGDTDSADYPTTSGAFDETANGKVDGFATRLSANGDALLWSTYFGGTQNDRSGGLALDPSGATTIVGNTGGGGFPTVPGSYDTTFGGGVFGGDAFCLRLDPSGSTLVFSTFLGGNKDEGATAVAVEATGEVTAAGTSTGNFPISAGAFETTFQAPIDAWVARLDAGGANLLWSTWLGGADDEQVTRIALDGSGDSTLVGWTEAADFPIPAGALDSTFAGSAEGFLVSLNAGGTGLNWGTFLGGGEDDRVLGLKLEAGGGLLVCGSTSSTDFVISPGAYDPTFNKDLTTLADDAFVTRLAPGASALVYSTFFGTPAVDRAFDVDLDAGGAAIFGGSTGSLNFPTSAGAIQPSFNFTAIVEGFVSRLAFLQHPIPYGAPKQGGNEAYIGWTGFPSLADDDLRIRIDGAVPGQRAILFHGFAPQASPFWGGTMYVLPPFQRRRPVFPDPFGFKQTKITIDPAWVGQKLYFQWWYRDPTASFKVGLSNALEVEFHP